MVKLPQTKHKKKLKAKLLRNDSIAGLFISNGISYPFSAERMILALSISLWAASSVFPQFNCKCAG
jgi:hypothetical protein